MFAGDKAPVLVVQRLTCELSAELPGIEPAGGQQYAQKLTQVANTCQNY
jgi:hypothetical protein